MESFDMNINPLVIHPTHQKKLELAYANGYMQKYANKVNAGSLNVRTQEL